MELKVKGDTFYVLEIEDEKRIYDTEGEAITSLKTLVSEKRETNFDEENTSIYEVKMGEKWEIKSMPWSRIALELIKGGK